MPQPQDPGIGVGPGGLIASLLNPGLALRVAQHLTPNPNPLFQQGQGAQPGAVDSTGSPVPQPPPGGNLAPAATTGPDPVNQANIAKLTQPDPSFMADQMRYQRVNALSNDLNRNLQGIAAGFGTAQQQASKQQALAGGGGGVGDSLGELAKMQAIQDKTISDNEHARFMGNAAVFAQMLSQQLGRPVSVPEAQIYMNDPDFSKQIAQAVGSNATQTEVGKNADAAVRGWAAAHRDATPADIANFRAQYLANSAPLNANAIVPEDEKKWTHARAAEADSLRTQHPDWTPTQIQQAVDAQIPPSILAQGAGSTPEETAYFQYAATERAAGRVPADFMAWKGQVAAKTAGDVDQAKAAADFKSTALEDYIPLKSKYDRLQPFVDTLMSDPGAAQEALASFRPTTGKWAIPLGATENVRRAAIALQALQSELKAEQLSGTKNVRNGMEFSTLGQAVTAGLDAAAPPDDFRRAIMDIQNKFLDAQATNELADGHRLTGKLVGHGNQDLTKSTLNGKANPFYNGGSQDNDFSGMSQADAVDAVKKLHTGDRYISPDGLARTVK